MRIGRNVSDVRLTLLGTNELLHSMKQKDLPSPSPVNETERFIITVTTSFVIVVLFTCGLASSLVFHAAMRIGLNVSDVELKLLGRNELLRSMKQKGLPSPSPPPVRYLWSGEHMTASTSQEHHDHNAGPDAPSLGVKHGEGRQVSKTLNWNHSKESALNMYSFLRLSLSRCVCSPDKGAYCFIDVSHLRRIQTDGDTIGPTLTSGCNRLW